MNAINITQKYLDVYYKYGSNANKTALSLTNNQSTSIDDSIEAIANSLFLENHWYQFSATDFGGFCTYVVTEVSTSLKEYRIPNYYSL